MIVAIADTHAVIWYLFSDPRLGKAASAFIDNTIANGNHVGVSAITIADPKAVLQYVPLDEHIAMKMMDVSRHDLPDLPDRIVAATASFYSVPLLTRDARIQGLRLKTIW